MIAFLYCQVPVWRRSRTVLKTNIWPLNRIFGECKIEDQKFEEGTSDGERNAPEAFNTADASSVVQARAQLSTSQANVSSSALAPVSPSASVINNNELQDA